MRANRANSTAPGRSRFLCMAELLPLVERLDPARLEERLWLTAACRASLAAQPDMNGAVRPR